MTEDEFLDKFSHYERGCDDGPVDTNLLVGKLLHAVLHNKVMVVKELLSQGVNVNARGQCSVNYEQAADDDGRANLSHAPPNAHESRILKGRPLVAATYRGSEEMVKLLLEHGADAAPPTLEKGAILVIPARHGQLGILKLLLEHIMANVKVEKGFYYAALSSAVYRGRQEVLQLLLDYKVDIDDKDEDSNPIIDIAVVMRRLEMVNFILNNGATKHGDHKMLKVLLDHGADVNAEEKFHGTALRAAATYGHEEAVNFLLEKGADITIQPPQDVRAQTIVHIAVQSQSIATVTKICEKGGDIYLEAQDADGQTPLGYALRDEKVDMVKYLLDRRASPDTPDFENISPLKLALKYRMSDMNLLHNAHLLEQLRANLNEQTERLAKFAEQYQDASSRILHEMPYKDVKSRMDNFSKAIQKLDKYAGQQLRNLNTSSQNMIELVRTYIDEPKQGLIADTGIQFDIYCRSAEIDVNKQKH
ncbi:MAG: hypothetical protein Q9201_003058 [Fulgogasparrea decipioides]